jgi:hypothetical protein
MDFLNKAKEQMSSSNQQGSAPAPQSGNVAGGNAGAQNEDYGDKGLFSPFFHCSVSLRCGSRAERQLDGLEIGKNEKDEG